MNLFSVEFRLLVILPNSMSKLIHNQCKCKLIIKTMTTYMYVISYCYYLLAYPYAVIVLIINLHLLWTRGGLMVSALVSRSSVPGPNPGKGHCVVFLGKSLYSRSASLHPGVQMGNGKFQANMSDIEANLGAFQAYF